MKVCCVVLIRIASTHNIPFSMQKRKITLNYPNSAAIETAVVDEPTVFETLKSYCITLYALKHPLSKNAPCPERLIGVICNMRFTTWRTCMQLKLFYQNGIVRYLKCVCRLIAHYMTDT